ncbi:hypothetical protein [Helicobacter suis]|uniref:hypothetical protein n=1 Tax=Helicobacter suis TaxID=104628 RepID=UPI0013D40DD4|nr:hypothetical protein [Helicobacter suis]
MEEQQTEQTEQTNLIVDNAAAAIALRKSLEEESASRVFGAIELLDGIEGFKKILGDFNARLSAIEGRLNGLEKQSQASVKLETQTPQEEKKAKTKSINVAQNLDVPVGDA